MLAHPKPTPRVRERSRLRRSAIARKSALKRGGRIARHKGVRKQRAGATAAMEREAWNIASAIVRSRGRCEYCGRPATRAELDAAHVISRRHEGTKYDLDNLLALHRHCHEKLGDAPIGKPSIMREYYERRYGPDRFGWLEHKARAITKFNPAILTNLRAIARALSVIV